MNTRKLWTLLKTRLRGLHEEEEGLETLQIVMIIAVAAIILLLIKYFWENIAEWATNFLGAVLGWDKADENLPTPAGP